MVVTGARGGDYKWIALSNTTVGIMMATINSSIVLISLPAIFRGIDLNPLVPQNVGYLLWMLMGYMVVTAVLVVSLGRIGDMLGRVRMYNLGFAVFTAASIGLSLVFSRGPAAALTLIGLRIVQGIGGAMLMANSVAILTDAFPENERGTALGINSAAGIAGSFIGLILGGLLSTTDWHLVFLVSVPVGLFGTVWAYLKLREIGIARRARIDWWGNLTFAAGLIAVLVGITYGIQPYGHSDTGWTNPVVLVELAGGVALLAAFALVEVLVPEPMFRLGLFRVPAFAAGNLAGLLASMGRGGLLFVLIIWLQGIWLPLHGFSFEQTPMWSAICMLPMTAGFLIAGPVSGYLSDRFGPRPFATGGMLAAAATFGLMLLLPADFDYPPFAALLLCNGLATGLFASPNTAGIMNAVPPDERGVASGMRATFQNAGMNLSIGLFFSLMIAGLSSSLPGTLFRGLTSQGVPAAVGSSVAHQPPVSLLFAAFLGYNPLRTLLGPVLSTLPPAGASYLTGNTFFPNLISGPFMSGIHLTFTFSLLMMLVAAGASWLRGGRYVYREPAVEAVEWAPAPRRPMVAISAAYGAAGGQVGRAVADVLGTPFVDRAIPGTLAERLAGRGGEPPAEGREASGLALMLEELGDGWPPFGPIVPADGHAADADLRARLERGIRELAGSTGAVILGHDAAVALRDRPDALRIRLHGPVEARMRRAMAFEALDEARARRRLEAADRAHQAYLRRLYGEDPTNPDLYHLVIDSTALPPEACTDLIVRAASRLPLRRGP